MRAVASVETTLLSKVSAVSGTLRSLLFLPLSSQNFAVVDRSSASMKIAHADSTSLTEVVISSPEIDRGISSYAKNVQEQVARLQTKAQPGLPVIVLDGAVDANQNVLLLLSPIFCAPSPVLDSSDRSFSGPLARAPTRGSPACNLGENTPRWAQGSVPLRLSPRADNIFVCGTGPLASSPPCFRCPCVALPPRAPARRAWPNGTPVRFKVKLNGAAPGDLVPSIDRCPGADVAHRESQPNKSALPDKREPLPEGASLAGTST
jgi:hypothetical protein